MAEVKFYLDEPHHNIYKKLSKEKKTEINAKVRKVYYRELDKAR